MYNADLIVYATPVVILCIAIWALGTFYVARYVVDVEMYNALKEPEETVNKDYEQQFLALYCELRVEISEPRQMDQLFDFSDVCCVGG